MATVTETVILVAGTTWTVPYTWNSGDNSITCIGGGAGGRSNISGDSGGGGGGARSISTNVSLTPGASVSIAIGGGGGAGSAGGDTTFNSSAIVAKGGSSTSTATGGAGGASASGTGGTKYSGGAGGNGSATYSSGGGGGGAAGDTANGSAGGSVTSYTGGSGGAGGATGGASSVAGSTGVSLSGLLGYNNGSSASGLGTNYAGGGGAGGGYEGGKGGYGVREGGDGGNPGGGGGGGKTGGGGAQGCIIITWTWQSVLPTSGAYAMSEIGTALKKSSTAQLDLNDSDVRTAFGKASGQIAFSDGYGKYRIPTDVTYINTTGTGSSPLALTSGGSNYGGWADNDLALAFVQNGQNVYPTQNNGPGWKYLDRVYSSHGYYLSVFSRVLHQGDANFYHTQALGGTHILIIRGGSVATVKETINRYNATSQTVPFTGFTKASNSKAIVSFICSRYPSDSGMTVPSGWTQTGSASWTYFYAKSARIDSASYTSGTGVTWTGLAYTGYYTTGFLIEIT